MNRKITACGSVRSARPMMPDIVFATKLVWGSVRVYPATVKNGLDAMPRNITHRVSRLTNLA